MKCFIAHNTCSKIERLDLFAINNDQEYIRKHIKKIQQSAETCYDFFFTNKLLITSVDTIMTQNLYENDSP